DQAQKLRSPSIAVKLLMSLAFQCQAMSSNVTRAAVNRIAREGRRPGAGWAGESCAARHRSKLLWFRPPRYGPFEALCTRFVEIDALNHTHRDAEESFDIVFCWLPRSMNSCVAHLKYSV